jgi:hypothetical protein
MKLLTSTLPCLGLVLWLNCLPPAYAQLSEVQISSISWPSEQYKKNAGWSYAADVVLQPLDATQYAAYLASDAEHQQRGIRNTHLDSLRSSLKLTLSSTLVPAQGRAKLELRSKIMTPELIVGDYPLLNIVIALVPRQGGEVLYRELMLSVGVNTNLPAQSAKLNWVESIAGLASNPESVGDGLAFTVQTSAIQKSRTRNRTKPTPIASMLAEPEQAPLIAPVALIQTPVAAIKQVLKPAQRPQLLMPPPQPAYLGLSHLDALQWLMALAGGTLAAWLLWRWWLHAKQSAGINSIPQGKMNRKEGYPDEALNTVFGDPDDLSKAYPVKN